MVQSCPLIDSADPDDPRQRHVEDAEAVDLADAQVHGQRGGRDEPAIEPRRGNCTVPIKQAIEIHRRSSGTQIHQIAPAPVATSPQPA